MRARHVPTGTVEDLDPADEWHATLLAGDQWEQLDDEPATEPPADPDPAGGDPAPEDALEGPDGSADAPAEPSGGDSVPPAGAAPSTAGPAGDPAGPAAPAPAAPKRPPLAAAVGAWRDYVVAEYGVDRAEADGMSKPQLHELARARDAS